MAGKCTLEKDQSDTYSYHEHRALAQQPSICLTLIYLSRGWDYLVLITEYYWPSSNSRVKMDGGMNDGKQLWAPEPTGSFF